MGVAGILEEGGHRAPGLKVAGEQAGELGFTPRALGSHGGDRKIPQATRLGKVPRRQD